jgi:hypothetical protein
MSAPTVQISESTHQMLQQLTALMENGHAAKVANQRIADRESVHLRGDREWPKLMRGFPDDLLDRHE